MKPDNILLRTESGPGADSGFPFTVKLVDLGLAKVCDDGDTARMTQTGLVMGTPVTMAPEQFTDPEGVDFRADIYGLGCVLYQCLTAVRAFPQRDIMAVMMAKSAGGVPDPSSLRPELPPGLTSLVKGLLAPKPADRPQTYSEVMALLAMFARGAAVAATPHPTPGIEAVGAGALKSTRIIAPQRAPESRPGSRRPVMAVAALAIASLVAVAWFAATRPEAAAPVAPVAADVAAAPAAGRGLAAPIAGAVRAAVKARRLAQRAGQQAPDGLAEPAPAAPDFTTMRFDVNLHAAFDAEPNRRMDAWTASGTARWTPDSEGEGEGTAVFATEGKGVLARPLTLTTFIAQVRLRDIDREAGIALLDEDGRMLSLSVQNFGSGNFKAAGREGAVVADGTPELKGAINVVPVTSVSDSPMLTLKASGGWVRGEVNGTEILTHQIGFLPHRTALFAIGSQGAKATVFVNFNVRAATGR